MFSFIIFKTSAMRMKSYNYQDLAIIFISVFSIIFSLNFLLQLNLINYLLMINDYQQSEMVFVGMSCFLFLNSIYVLVWLMFFSKYNKLIKFFLYILYAYNLILCLILYAGFLISQGLDKF